MTGNRFEGADRPGDYTGNLARRLHRESEKKIERDRLLAGQALLGRSADTGHARHLDSEIEAEMFDSSQFDEEIIDYTGQWAGWTPPVGKTRDETGKIIDEPQDEY